MTTKKNTHGGKREGAGKPKGPVKILVSGRVSVTAHEAIIKRADAAGRTLSAEVALILEAVSDTEAQ